MTEVGIASPTIQGRDDPGWDGPTGRPGWDDEGDRPDGFAGVVQAFDERVDRWFEPLRGAPSEPHWRCCG